MMLEVSKADLELLSLAVRHRLQVLEAHIRVLNEKGDKLNASIFYQEASATRNLLNTINVTKGN